MARLRAAFLVAMLMAAYSSGVMIPEAHALSLLVSPSSATTTPGGTVTFEVQQSPTGGWGGELWTRPFILFISPPEPGVDATFSPNNRIPYFYSTMTVRVDVSKPLGTYTLHVWLNEQGCCPDPYSNPYDTVKLVVVPVKTAVTTESTLATKSTPAMTTATTARYYLLPLQSMGGYSLDTTVPEGPLTECDQESGCMLSTRVLLNAHKFSSFRVHLYAKPSDAYEYVTVTIGVASSDLSDFTYVYGNHTQNRVVWVDWMQILPEGVAWNVTRTSPDLVVRLDVPSVEGELNVPYYMPTDVWGDLRRAEPVIDATITLTNKPNPPVMVSSGQRLLVHFNRYIDRPKYQGWDTCFAGGGGFLCRKATILFGDSAHLTYIETDAVEFEGQPNATTITTVASTRTAPTLTTSQATTAQTSPLITPATVTVTAKEYAPIDFAVLSMVMSIVAMSAVVVLAVVVLRRRKKSPAS